MLKSLQRTRRKHHLKKGTVSLASTQAPSVQVGQELSELIAVALLFAFALCRLDAHLLIVFLKRGQVLTSF